MAKNRRHSKMDVEQWSSTVDPSAMIRYLEDAGCYLEFELFFMNCFDRIRHEMHSRAIIDTAFALHFDVDELTHAAQAAIDKMIQRLRLLDENSVDWERLHREIRFSKAVLAREYHDFGEANRFLSSYLIEISDDPTTETKTQADFLRSTFDFPFVPLEEE